MRRSSGSRRSHPTRSPSTSSPRMARGDRTDRAPEVLDAQPDCAVCDVVLRRRRRPPTRAASTARSAAAARSASASGEAAWSAARESLGLLPRGRARARPACTDVRRGSHAARHARGGRDGRCRRSRSTRPVRWPPGPMDPRHQLWVEVALPPGYGYPNLYDVRDGLDVTRCVSAGDGEGVPRLTARRLRPQHVARVRPRVPRRPAPSRRAAEDEGACRRRSSAAAGRSASVPGDERDAFLDAVRRTPAQLRTLLAELDGAVDVVGGSEACLSADACEDVDGERASGGHRRVGEPRRDRPRARARRLRPGTRRAGSACVSIGLHPDGLGERAIRPALGAVRRPGRALGARQGRPAILAGCRRASSRDLLRDARRVPPALGTWAAST